MEVSVESYGFIDLMIETFAKFQQNALCLFDTPC